MANYRISKEKRTMILATLFEGAAVNSVCRVFKVGKPALLRFLCEAGAACEDWHDRNFRDLTVELIELDEQWAYVGMHKERMTKAQKQDNPNLGDCWLWAAIDPVSKAILSWRTGKRTKKSAYEFAYDLAARVPGQVQITSDKLVSYKSVIPDAFMGRVDYAQELKVFAKDRCKAHEWNQYSVNPLVGVERETICGKPDLKTATVCHIERYFLTVRQGNKRTSRKTIAYSKKWSNHGHASSVFNFIYNMVRKHESLKEAPAVALGVIDRRWTLEQVVEMVDAYLARIEDEKFEAAFEGFTLAPKVPRAYAQQAPKTPWYLDPESGGPNPAVKKEGVKYEDAEE